MSTVELDFEVDPFEEKLHSCRTVGIFRSYAIGRYNSLVTVIDPIYIGQTYYKTNNRVMSIFINIKAIKKCHEQKVTRKYDFRV